jgi:hypothetical protein
LTAVFPFFVIRCSNEKHDAPALILEPPAFSVKQFAQKRGTPHTEPWKWCWPGPMPLDALGRGHGYNPSVAMRRIAPFVAFR